MDIPAALPVSLDSDQPITADVPCRRCGYNLRGLTAAGRCPECGTPVGLSIQGDLLRFADPAWVETLARGAKIILWGILIAVIASVCGGVLAALTGTPAVQVLVSVAGGLVGIYGTWLVTSPDPSGVTEDRYARARKFIRFALIVGLLAQVLGVFQTASAPGTTIFALLLLVAAVMGLINAVGEFARLTYIRALAVRVPDPKLAGRASFLRWAWGIILAFSTLAGIAAAIAVSTRAGTAWLTGGAPAGGAPGGTPASPAGGMGGFGGMGLFACAISAVGLAFVVFGIMYLSMLLRLRKVLREQAEFARQTWARVLPRPPATAPS